MKLYIQGAAQNAESSDAALTCIFGSVVTSGNMVAGFVSCGFTVLATLASVADDRGNT
jgi:hypothetical protein